MCSTGPICITGKAMETNSHTTEDIINAAKEAAAWCEIRWNSCEPRSSLRNLEFSPEFFGSNHYYTVNSLICSRRYELERLGLDPAPDLRNGKILVYEPDTNIFDGLSESETDGFFDVNDCPPWDTWVGYITTKDCRYVLSWVFNEAIPLVNAGAEVNCVECFYWLSTVNDTWAKELNIA